MPAKRLGDQPIRVSKYDVVAQDSTDVPHFVRHIGLAGEERDNVIRKSEIRMVHMGPPLSRDDGTHPLDVAATAVLNVGQLRQIGIFVDEHISEYEAGRIGKRQQYVIVPHVREPDEECSCRRFNCAGFVIEAYEYAGLDLVDTKPVSLPAVTLDTLCKAFPDAANQLQSPKIREKYGLLGDGPWPVVLAGYVLNSLDRLADEIRTDTYSPVSGDEYFPRRTGRSDRA